MYGYIIFSTCTKGQADIQGKNTDKKKSISSCCKKKKNDSLTPALSEGGIIHKGKKKEAVGGQIAMIVG